MSIVSIAWLREGRVPPFKGKVHRLNEHSCDILEALFYIIRMHDSEHGHPVKAYLEEGIERRGVTDMRKDKRRERLLQHCDRGFWPYADKVLARIPRGTRNKDILGDDTLSIVSFGGCVGMCCSLEQETRHLIVLADSLLNEPEYEIIHTIAHELAHKVAATTHTELHEKAAEELLIAWGFKEESEMVKYDLPISEGEGFRIGSEWARKQDDLSRFEEFYDEWNERRLSASRLGELLDMADITSILRDMGLMDFESEGITLLQAEEILKAGQPLDEGRVDMSIIWGIMGVLRERKTREAATRTSREERRAEFKEQLERVYLELGKLTDLADYCPAGRETAIALVGGVFKALESLE